MIKINEKLIEINKFPDGTLLLKENPKYTDAKIFWNFENNEELVVLIYLTNHLRSNGVKNIELHMPYIPNARQDRVKNQEDVFTLKYFADIINYLKFDKVVVLDPHSSVSEAVFDNLIVKSPQEYIENVINKVYRLTNNAELMVFYPDEGAMKRYVDMNGVPYTFGIKRREWRTGKILGLDVCGNTDEIKGKNILIIDDISSRGGTFYHSAKKLKELGANKIFLYITHCENTILEGDVLTSGYIDKIFTTNSIFTAKHERIEVLK